MKFGFDELIILHHSSMTFWFFTRNDHHSSLIIDHVKLGVTFFFAVLIHAFAGLKTTSFLCC
jgi:hypothetical protein